MGEEIWCWRTIIKKIGGNIWKQILIDAWIVNVVMW
jgi:hypothetical protein